MICLDELGPVAAKRYPSPSWSDDAHRPHFHPDYARQADRWAFGALAHRSGEVVLHTATTRDTAAWLCFLDRLQAFAPPGDAYLIVDALPLHWTVDTMLWNGGHPRFHLIPLPKRAAWLNLSEGFWKILRQRSLAGRVGHNAAEVDLALHVGVADWNTRPTPFLWGRSPRPTRRPTRRLKTRSVYRS